MALASVRVGILRTILKSGSWPSVQRSMSYKSSISLETLYPNSSLKFFTPSFDPLPLDRNTVAINYFTAEVPDPDEKFSGFIPIEKLDITYSASSGPGGQNVNKVHTKVDLRFKLSDADWLHPDVKQRMIELHGNRLSKEGYLIIRSDSTRSQQLNLADCMQKLRSMVRDAAVTKRQPSPETEEKIRQRQLKAARLRLAVKREAAHKRELRRPPTVVDL